MDNPPDFIPVFPSILTDFEDRLSYLACEFPVHYTCGNAETNLKFTASTKGYNSGILNSLMQY